MEFLQLVPTRNRIETNDATSVKKCRTNKINHFLSINATLDQWSKMPSCHGLSFIENNNKCCGVHNNEINISCLRHEKVLEKVSRAGTNTQ